MQDTKVALITGSAKRIGACIATHLQDHGMRVVIHYHHSEKEANTLCATLNAKRVNSAIACHANLNDSHHIPYLISTTINTFGRLDVLINNAATFSPTPLDGLALRHWHQTIASNLTAPFLLSVNAAPHLKDTQGCIINMVDIRASQPLKHYTPYCISKAGLMMATKSLALEWAPDIRVNGIAPGVVLWPDQATSDDLSRQKKIIARTPLKRVGTPYDIVKAVYFLVEQAPYLTGQVITVDGGRSLS